MRPPASRAQPLLLSFFPGVSLLQPAAMTTPALDIPLLVLEYLESKSLFGAERALRTELALAQQEEDGTRAHAKNLFTSQLERLLKMPSSDVDLPLELTIEDFSLQPSEQQLEVTEVEDDDAKDRSAALMNKLQPAGQRARTRPRLVNMSIFAAVNDERTLRSWHGRGTPQTRVVFHDPAPMTEAQGTRKVLRFCPA